MENQIVKSEKEKSIGTRIRECYFVGCKKSQKSDKYFELDLVFTTESRKNYNNGYSVLKTWPKIEAMPNVVIPFMAKVQAEFLDVPEGEKPVFLRIANLSEFEKKE